MPHPSAWAAQHVEPEGALHQDSPVDVPRFGEGRADLARQLIASLDEDADTAGDDVEAAWLDEVERRLSDAEGGTAKFEPWEIVEERIAARLLS